MSYVLSSKMFAERGDPWDYRARQEQKPSGVIVREVRGPHWRELSHRWLIDGFGPDGEPALAPVRKPEPRAVAPLPLHLVPKPGERRSLPPEGKHFHRGEELRGKPVPLTDEQQALRKKQRAAVKARETRARNRRERERQEVLNIILGL
jgi:hypothetical protein